MKRGSQKMIAFTAVFAAILIFAGRAEAYSIEGPSTAAPGGSSYNLTTPFENFFQSLQNTLNAGGGSTVNLNPIQEPAARYAQVDIRGWLNQFDAWLYGYTGFHILNFFTEILTIFSIILGWLKTGVDWLLNYL